MKSWIVLTVFLLTILNACAVQEKLSMGSKDSLYNVTFELVNCKNCSINTTSPLQNPNSDLYSFQIESGNNSGMVWMEQYKELQDATLPFRPNFRFKGFNPLDHNTTVKKTTVSGKDAWLVQVKSPIGGKDLFIASFWLDDKRCECGPVSVGKTYVEVASDLPANVTSNLLQTLEFKK